jgi:hypothetical protein
VKSRFQTLLFQNGATLCRYASALAAAQVWKTELRNPNFGVDVFCAVVAASCSVSLVAWLAVGAVQVESS